MTDLITYSVYFQTDMFHRIDKSVGISYEANTSSIKHNAAFKPGLRPSVIEA